MKILKFTFILFIVLFSYNSISFAATTHLGNNISSTGTLTIDGALKFTSGAVANYILSSDSSGNATWVSLNSALSNTDTDSLPEGTTNKYYDSSREGAANGIATLDSNSLVPLTNLPTGPNGLATLDGSGQLLAGQVPSFTLSHTYTVADISEREMLLPQRQVI